MMNIKQPVERNAHITESRLIPIDMVNRLRHDDAWSEAVQHLEQGLLGLGIKYTQECKAKTEEIDQAIHDELSELRFQVRELRLNIRADNMGIEAEIKDEVRKMGVKVNELKEQVESEPKTEVKKPMRKAISNKTSIQVSREFKHLLKVMKGKKSYEELLKDKMCL